MHPRVDPETPCCCCATPLPPKCGALHRRFAGCQHWEGNVLIEPGPAGSDGRALSATNRSYWQAVDGARRVSMGVHEDEFVRHADGWRFARRVVLHTWSADDGDSVPPIGSTADSRDDQGSGEYEATAV